MILTDAITLSQILTIYQFHFGLFEPGAHVHIAEHARRVVEMLAGMFGSATAKKHPTQAEMGTSCHRSHAEALGKR
jgi:hypothetical protein